MSELKTNELVLENGRARHGGTGSGRREFWLARYWEREKNREMAVYWLYGLLVTVAEVIVAYKNIKFGIFIHLLLMGALLTHSALAYKKGTPWLYLALTLAPLTRVLSLSMPLAGIPTVYWYVAIGVPLLAAAAGVARVAGYKVAEVGLTLNNMPVQFLIALIGFPLGFIEYQILKPAPIVSPFSPGEIWLPALVLIVFTGFVEEFIFRGVMYRAALVAAGKLFAYSYASFIFAVLHITHLSPLDVAFVFAVALLFTRIFVWQRSIVGLTLAHGLTNITLYIICPLVFK